MIIVDLETGRGTIERRQFIASMLAAVLFPRYALADRKGREKGRRRKRQGDDHDFNHADRGRRAGDIVPLRNILEKVGKTFKGDIVGIEFEHKNGLPVYEIKMINENGRYLEIYINATTSKIIKVEGK